MTSPIHPTVFSSDSASDTVSKRIFRGMNTVMLPAHDHLYEAVLTPTRNVLKSGRKLPIEDVRRYTDRAAEILAGAGEVVGLTHDFRHDRVRKTARGAVRWFGLTGNSDQSAGICSLAFTLQRDRIDWLMGDTNVVVRSHAVTRYFRRMQRDFEAFRDNAASLVVDATFLAPLLGHDHDIALATPHGLLCGRTQPPDRRASYAQVEMCAWRGAPSSLRESVRHSPLSEPPATVPVVFATFIDADSLGLAKERLYQRLNALQDAVRPVAAAHLRHVLFAEPFDRQAARSAVDAVRAFQAEPEWLAYLDRIPST